jgi:hypothetical protein
VSLVALINEQKVFFRIARRNPPKISKFGGAFFNLCGDPAVLKNLRAAGKKAKKAFAPHDFKLFRTSRNLTICNFN